MSADSITPAPPARHPLALRICTPEERAAVGGWVFQLDPPEIVRGRLEVLASHGPNLRAGGITFGVEEYGYIIPTAFTFAFINRLYETGWVDVDAPWTAARERGARYIGGWDTISETETDALREATAFHLHRRLTAIARIGRLTDGVIERAFESGLMLQIIERAEALLSSGA